MQEPQQDVNAEQKAIQKLDELATGSEKVILEIRAVFPFDFFPDEVILDETKVSIHRHYFFFTKEVRSIEYKDIFNVAVNHGLFFASLEISDRFFSQDALVVTFLTKGDALLARRIIQGMMIALKDNIDVQSLPVDELLKKLNTIGQSR